MVHGLGFDVRALDLSEFAKAEGGVTCLSILIE
jgi:N-dimethylarginine dimethylaminohydrolase